jgi:(p)ppGpp synthase/HD superfamily hydrolase
MNDSLVDKARHIALKAHTGQLRKDKKTPYFNHVEQVAKNVKPQEEKYIAAAYLHDVVEDTDLSSKDLSDAGVPDDVVEAVLLLTKFNYQPYEKYIEAIKGNVIAKAVKIADMSANLNDDPSFKQVIKYTRYLEYLQR